VTIRVLVVDDQALVRAGFVKLLEPEDDLHVVGEAGDGAEAVEAAARTRPDVVLMDIRMPRLDGIEATRRVRAAGPAAPRVLVLTTYDLDEYVFEALKAGASGFLLKDAPADQLVGGIRLVAAGDALLAPAVTRRLIEEFARRPVPPLGGPPELAALTSREREILVLVARGMTNAEIATELVLGASTVKTHVGNVLSKLDLRDRVQAVVLAYETGLVVPGDRP
jgi:DNA-binding NarL/FixJ family response regulator